MNPIKLSMRNFKSYGENAPELDFSAFDVILLTGDNGNGKSSIADAIAWVLWGQCKGTTQRSGMDDLVRIGASDMEVCFVFEEDGLIHKVIRKRDRNRGQTSLDLSIYDGKNRFVPAGGSTLSETQAKIEKIIKLDYDTYLCTAYLSQGKADLFAMKTPKERKQILAEILNLSIYDKLEKRAQEKRRAAENSREVLAREINTLLTVIAEKKDAEERLNVAEEELRKIEKEKKVVSAKIEELNAVLQDKEFSKSKEKDCFEVISRTKREKETLEKNFLIISDRIKAYDSLLKNESTITQRYMRLQTLRSENEAFTEKLRQVTDLGKIKDKVERSILSKEESLKNEIKLIELEARPYRQKCDKFEELFSRKSKLAEELIKLEDIEKQCTVVEETEKAEVERLSVLSANVRVFEEKRNENIEKLEILKMAGSLCPVCSNFLDDDHKKELITETEANEDLILKEITKLKLEVKDAENKVRALNQRKNDFKVLLKTRMTTEAQMKSVSDGIAEAEFSKNEIEKLSIKITQLNAQLSSRNYSLDEQIELSRLNRQINDIGYASEVHRQLENEIKTLKEYQERWVELQKAKSALAADSEHRKQISERVNEKTNLLEDLGSQLVELSMKTKDIPLVMDQIKSAQIEKLDIESRTSDLETKKGMLIERLNTVKSAEKEIEVKQKELNSTEKMVNIYKVLSEIYGKSGIQAAIIENAIPELEIKTNEILGRITDGRLVVEFLTQRDKKSGGTIETLDLKISDESGTRKYETYSGGEEFRINFAIRIALSKVLAHRAGASLRMLILDEGFGVLDEQGREKLVQAINSIRDEFDKILVITHIQDLKDAFPIRLEITKNANGSNFRMTG